MKKSSLLLNQRGIGLLEAMIAAGILGGVITASLMVMESAISAQNASGLVIRMQAAQSTIIATLQSDLAWAETVNNEKVNPTFECIRKKTDCSSAGGSFALYNGAGVATYDGTINNSGFTMQGKPCLTFNKVTGDPACPVHLIIAWQPMCDAASPGACYAPAAVLTGEFVYSNGGKVSSPINFGLLRFNFLRQRIYCSNPNPPAFALSLAYGDVTVGPDSVASTPPAGVGAAKTSVLEPCFNWTISFHYSAAYSGGALESDAKNVASMCLATIESDPATPSCRYLWSFAQGKWTLYDSAGATLYTSTVSEQGDPAGVYELQSHNGEITFYYNGTRRVVFPETYGYGLQAILKPAAANYSTEGFTSVQFLK